MNHVFAIPLFAWGHVVESGRPSDTGERTSYGHRIIHRPGFGRDSIEFPFNSGQLIAPNIYAGKLSEARHTAAPAMLAQLKRWKEFAENNGWDRECSLYQATVRAIADAEGM